MRIGFFISPYDKINYTWVKYLKIKEIIKNVRKQISFPIILEWGKPQFDIKQKYKNDKLEKYSHYP